MQADLTRIRAEYVGLRNRIANLKAALEEQEAKPTVPLVTLGYWKDYLEDMVMLEDSLFALLEHETSRRNPG